MEFKHESKGNKLYITISGDILFVETTDLSDYFERMLKEEFEEAVLDFSDVSGINSSAIGKVIDFHQKLTAAGKKMRISGMSEKAYSVFKYFKLDELFPFEK